VIVLACRSLVSGRPHKIMNRCLVDHGLVRPWVILPSSGSLVTTWAEWWPSWAGLWQARRESALRQRRSADRRRGEDAGCRHDLALADRVLVTLAVLWRQIPHAALAVMCGVYRSCQSAPGITAWTWTGRQGGTGGPKPGVGRLSTRWCVYSFNRTKADRAPYGTGRIRYLGHDASEA
jgi:hypothetical protein